MNGPLTGIRVVEFAHIMAGPVCGLLLADMGADVIKVERLPGGDGTRSFVPPDIEGESAAFMMLNRGKRGVALDLRSAEGVEAARRLAVGADVVLENFRVGTMERLGLGFDTLVESNPRLVYGQITGFGRTGPLASQGGFDLIAQGYSGLQSITGEGPGRPPVKIGAPVTDITAGILMAFGVVSALFERERTGRGQRVDTSLLEAGITQTFWQSAIVLASGISPGPLGSAHPLSAPYQTFETADGYVNVGASNEATWLGLTRALGAPELAADERFATNAARLAGLDALVAEVTPRFLSESSEHWLRTLAQEGVPAGPIASVGEMLEHPQTLAREMVVETRHSRLGSVRSLGSPLKMSGSGRGVRGAGEVTHGEGPPLPGAPSLGEHTRSVLLEAGFSEGGVDRLVASGCALAP